METISRNDDCLSEIIRLQLKKPKRWNWELTTSRSSPHISLPVIQLYNARGKLLVEAKESKESGSERRSWHSNDWAVNNRNRNPCNDNNLRPLQKCTSDILHRQNRYDNLLTKYDQSCTKRGYGRTGNINLEDNISSAGNRPICDESKEHGLRHKTNDVPASIDLNKNYDDFKEKNRRNNHKYIKSKSALTLGASVNKDNDNQIPPFFHNKKVVVDVNSNRLNTISDMDQIKNSIKNAKLSEDIMKASKNISRHAKPIKKSGSALIRFSEDTKKDPEEEEEEEEAKRKLLQGYKRSMSDNLYKKLLKYNEESLKRAVTDGYKKFLNTEIDKLNNNNDHERIEKIDRKISPSKLEVNRVKYSKYITRTCSAGTLVIKEESFSNPNVRRRRKTIENGCDNIKDESSNFKRKDVYPRKVDSFRHDISYPHMIADRNRAAVCDKKDSLRLRAYDLFHSKSDVFPFGELFQGGVSNNVSNYTVVEPSSESRRTSEDVGGVEKFERKRRSKARRRSTDGSTSRSSGNFDHNEMGNSVKARVVKEHKKDAIGDAELLRLVRGLNNDHAKMGANVSRHSSKGLSGRRTQSSGSICNGKGTSGRHTNSEPKICGSLPSYLDESDDTGCNNNHHECEKPPLQDVERIPPLGDGAPLHWKFSDTQTALCDQGYGSERSPEEEYPPPLPEHDNQCHHHLDLHSCYPFITPESTFTVSLAKGSRGLGLSVTGGVDSGGSWPGLIRVKRLFPHQPAASCEMLHVGDLILEVNGITLTGLTNYEALEVLRTASNQVELKICRPPPDVLSCVSPISEAPPPPPRREPPSSLNLASISDDEHSLGEFEVTMRKLQGSLGFTLRKEDDSALGHYIRALVREPALTDARIRAGDKIIAVNDVEISSMTHEEAVQFLRQSGEIVKLRLYRDLAQTPVATLSPTETTPRTSFSKKTQLRQEAVDMLNDIAVRKLIPGNQDYGRRSQSPNTSPRRLRRQACPSDASQTSDSSGRHLITDEQFHEGLLKKCSFPLDEDSFNSLFIEDDDCDKPSRPSSLDLYNPNQTPVVTRKPKFNFSLAHNAYELNNLDADILDAPNLTYNLGPEDVKSTEVECGDSFPQEPASMPHIPTDNPGFSYKNPAYQSAHPQCGTESGDEKTPKATDDNSMKKWKGVVFTADEEKERDRERRKSIRSKTPVVEEEDKYEILAIELNRGWNSRLGFSLQGAAGVTYVSAVHADSVAARDGRIKPGDCLIKVNDESVEHMTTSEIIDLLRIVRGPVCIVVSRTKSKEDCIKSNAAN